MAEKKETAFEIQSEAKNPNLLFWKIQKLIVGILFLFLIASFLGLMGPGILSEKKAQSPDGLLKISYDSISRRNLVRPITFKVTANNSKVTTISFPQSYIDHYDIKNIIPTPTHTELKNNRIYYSFSSIGVNNNIIFMLEPLSLGIIKTNIESNRSTVDIEQFIYP